MNNETFLSYDDAIEWCSVCGGPIFEGMPYETMEGYVYVGVDRHGEKYTSYVGSQVFHSVNEHCVMD